MTLSRRVRALLGVAVALILAVVYAPLLVVIVNSFNADRTFGWPPSGFTLEWWTRATRNAAATRSRWP